MNAPAARRRAAGAPSRLRGLEHRGSLDHVVPRSRGGKDAWENLVWSAKEVNQRKADRLPQEAGLKLLSKPRPPKELPASAFIRNPHEVDDWNLFLG